MPKPMRKQAVFVRILCAIALFCVGFAHKLPALPQAAIPAQEWAQYVLPDGALPVLCLTHHDEGKSGSSDFGSGCDACRLSASTILPSPPGTAGEPMQGMLAVLLPPGAEAFHRHLFPPNASPRGPPRSGFVA